MNKRFSDDDFPTFFLPGGRAAPDDVADMAARMVANEVMCGVLGALSGVVLLLNRERQIVAVNTHFLRSLGFENPEALIGLRPGEALGCTNVEKCPSGCGTGESCRCCGAAVAILAALETEVASSRECLISTERNGEKVSHEFVVTAKPIVVSGQEFILFVMNNVDDRKRREALERVFIHDLANTFSAIQGWFDVMEHAGGVPSQIGRGLTALQRLFFVAKDDLQNQRILLLAETGRYVPMFTTVDLLAIRGWIEDHFSEDPVADGKPLSFSGAGSVSTDRGLLRRVVINGVRNALEASLPGDEISVSLKVTDDVWRLEIRNPKVVSPDIVAQVFKRCFTTKHGVGHGLGSYSIRLFTEKYLNGSVEFRSNAGEGSVLTIVLPLGNPSSGSA